MTKKTKTYNNEFKAEVVKKIADNNGNLSEVLKALIIQSQSTISISTCSV